MSPIEIVIVIAVALLMAVVWGILHIFGRAVHAAGEPVCGKCGYNVKGLTTFTCPECGSDLREVGIARPRGRSTSRELWWKLLGFGIVWLIGAGIACAFLPPSDRAVIVWVIISAAGLFGGLVLIGYLHAQKVRARGPVIDEIAPLPMARSAKPTTRTATIMFSDIADFSAAAASAPRGALIELVRRHREMVQGIALRRAGRIVKSIGDGLLIHFESATEALLAGLEIQTAMRERNSATFSVGEKFHLRIAVATGEVTETSDDVFGHPVNLASRVQQLATNGDVYFTESTYHAINRNEVGSESVGSFELKGVGSVNVYRAVTPS